MTSTASSTAGTPEEQPINEHALTEPNAELSAPENTTDRVETEAPAEAPTRVYLHPEQLAMIQTPCSWRRCPCVRRAAWTPCTRICA